MVRKATAARPSPWENKWVGRVVKERKQVTENKWFLAQQKWQAVKEVVAAAYRIPAARRSRPILPSKPTASANNGSNRINRTKVQVKGIRQRLPSSDWWQEKQRW